MTIASDTADSQAALRTKPRLGLLAVCCAYAVFVALVVKFLPALLPDRVALEFLSHELVIDRIHTRVLDNLYMLVAFLPLAFLIEGIVVGWEKCSFRQIFFAPTASVKTDIAVLVIDQMHLFSIVGRILMFGASMISWMWLRQLIADKTGFAVDPSGIPLPLQVVLFFFISSFFDYWTHRASHSALLWPIHRYHHSAEDFCILTSGRQHPANFVPIFFMNLPMALLGAQPEVMIYVVVLTQLPGLLIHSKINSDWGWIGKYLLQSPVHHRMHHKLDMTHPTIHFSTVPLWDRLFGTWDDYYNPDEPIGVDTRYRHGFWIVPDMLRDYVDLWKGFFALVWKPAK